MMMVMRIGITQSGCNLTAVDVIAEQARSNHTVRMSIRVFTAVVVAVVVGHAHGGHLTSAAYVSVLDAREYAAYDYDERKHTKRQKEPKKSFFFFL